MTPAEFCIRRPTATIMIFISCLALGGISAKLLPLEYFPSLDVPFLFIDMPYPGSTPAETERLITRPAEEALATLKGVKFINSSSSPDGSQLFMLFDWKSEIAIKAVEARERLEVVRDQLPDDLRRIIVFKFNTADSPMLTLRISSERDLSEAYDMLTRNLVRPIERVPGVARVVLQGVERKEIRINLIADEVEAQGINLNQLNATLRSSNFAASAGLITDGNRRYRVNPVGEFRSVDEVRNLVINQRGTRLSDIAEITYEPGERNYARHLDQHYAIGLEIHRERGANLVEVAELVLVEVDKAGKSREMQGINLFFLENQAAGVVESLSDLLGAGLLGMLLSLLVLYFFLRNLITTLMVALAVPISITITLGAMYMMGLSLNVLSMMGLMLAVGMLVDNAVVVSESIFTERENHPGNPVAASIAGVRMVGLAVLAGTLTSMAVFLPNLFGEMDQIQIFLQHVAAAICISLLASLVLAQTLIPMIAARVSVPSQQDKNQGIERFKQRYARFLDWTLGHRWWAWGGIIAILLSVGIPGALVDVDMFPEEVDRDLFLRFNLDAKYPLAKIKPAVDLIEDYLYDHQEEFEIRAVYTYYDENGTAQSSILLTPDDEAIRSSTEIKEAIREGLPKIAIGRPSFDQNRSAGSEGVTLSIIGDSSELLVELSKDVVFALRQIKGLRDVKTSSGAGDREVAVRVDRARASLYGFSAQEVASAIAVALRGTQLSDFRGQDGEVPMTLRFRDADTQNVEQLKTLTLKAADGTRVPITSLVSFSVRTGPVNIQRNDRETALQISATLHDKSMDEIREDIKATLDAFNFPAGYSWKFGRGFEFNDDTATKMLTNIGLAVLFIYLIMAALFESFLHPLAIVSGIIFSVVGVYWFFLVTGTTFSLMAFIGILILIGVVVNNGIVLIDHTNQLRRSGLPRREAIVQAGRDRIRPILMTVGTTVLGLLPLCIGTTQIGGDGPPYFPMARAIVGGLMFSTMISLCVLPTIYSTLDDLSFWSTARLKKAMNFRLLKKARGIT